MTSLNQKNENSNNLFAQGLLNNKYRQEWLDSAVSPDIIALNVKSISGDLAYEHLLYNIPESERLNSGRLNSRQLKKYKNLDNGGWWASGVDVLTGEDLLWGCFKPNERRIDQDGKPIKYEHPASTDTEIFALKVPDHIWQAIGLKGKVHPSSPIDAKVNYGFWQWVIANPSVPIVITEGAKKAGALLTAGYVAIALPGIWNGFKKGLKGADGKLISKRELKDCIAVFAKGNRKVTIAFDCDSKKKTMANVRQAVVALGWVLKSEGCTVNSASWDNAYKGIDDLIAGLGYEALDTAITKAKDFQYLGIQETLDIDLFNPIRINTRFVNQAMSILPEGVKVMAIKSPKSTGKTEFMADIVKLAHANNNRVIVLTHRNQLGSALANRFNIDHLHDVRTSETKGALGLALCLDSLHADCTACFRVKDWAGATVVIDEIAQVLHHLFNASTAVQKKRATIIKNLKELLQFVLATGGQVISADADLSAIELNFLKSVTGYQPYVILNEFNELNKGKLTWYQGTTSAELVADLERAVLAGERALVHVSAQKANSKYSAVALAKHLKTKAKAKGLEIKILVIDSETIADPNSPAFGAMDKLNEVLSQYDVVITTPTIETGVSIDIKNHFDGVWVIASGVQTVDSVCQTLERLRESVPRHVWVTNSAHFSKIAGGSFSWKGLRIEAVETASAIVKALSDADYDKEAKDRDHEACLEAWSKRSAEINYGLSNYRDEILEKLEIEGYKVFGNTTNKVAERITKDALKTNVEEIYAEHKASVVSASATSLENDYGELDRDKIRALSDKKARTVDENLQLKKAKIREFYHLNEDEITEDVIEFHDQIGTTKVRKLYYLTDGSEFMRDRDSKKLASIAEQNDGKIFAPDVKKSTFSSYVGVLKAIKIEQFLDPTAKFTDASLQPWLEALRANRHVIKTALGITVHEKSSAVKIAQTILKQAFGLRMEGKNIKTTNSVAHNSYIDIKNNLSESSATKSKQERQYTGVKIPHIYQATLGRMLTHDTEVRERAKRQANEEADQSRQATAHREMLNAEIDSNYASFIGEVR